MEKLLTEILSSLNKIIALQKENLILLESQVRLFEKYDAEISLEDETNRDLYQRAKRS